MRDFINDVVIGSVQRRDWPLIVNLSTLALTVAALAGIIIWLLVR